MKKKSFLTRTNIFIRSLIFTFFMSTVTIFYSFFCIAARILPFRYRYAIIMAWNSIMVWALKVICHVDYVIEGLDNIPKDRNGIILSKHQSTWETFLLPTLFHQAAIILKQELLWVPFFGWGLAIIDPIAINRRDPASAMDQVITKGKKCLQEGRWILVFPEGTRITPGQVGKYRLGGARLATTTGYPVIPVAHNAGRHWPKRGFIKTPGTIRVVIGSLIETTGRTPEEVLEQAKHWIEQTMTEIDPPSLHSTRF